jgi:hypothetical protein
MRLGYARSIFKIIKNKKGATVESAFQHGNSRESAAPIAAFRLRQT